MKIALSVLCFIGLACISVPASAGTLLRQSFESADLPARSFATTGGATATVAYGQHGTIDTPTNVAANAADAPSKGLLFTVNSSAASGPWQASLSSGVLTLTTNNTTITDLRLITLAFSLRVSRAHPVVVRLESYDDAGTTRTGGLRRLIYPAAPNYTQRFALDLSTFAADGAGAFSPTAKKILLAFELDSTAGGDGWPAASGLTLQLDNLHYATPAYYVAASGGADNTSGGRGTTAALPHATINYAIARAQPGDIIVVRGGTYNGGVHFRKSVSGVFQGVAGAPDAWITLKNYPGETPVLRHTTWGVVTIGLGTSSATYTGATPAYIELRGLTVRGYNTTDANGDRGLDPAVANPLLSKLGTAFGETNCNGIYIEGRSQTQLLHSIRVADNVVENNSGGGISFHRADRLLVENNVVRNNAWWCAYGPSGISTLVPADYENNPDPRIVIQGNQSTGNETHFPWIGAGKFSDGNGIIIDVNRNAEAGGDSPDLNPDPAYRGKTLVQNNLVANNGGSGIHAFNAQNVDILHNTAYLNSASPRLVYAQIYAAYAKNVRMINNVLVAPANPTGNSAFNEPHTTNSQFNVSGIVFQNNLYHGLGNNVALPANTAAFTASANTLADPLFLAPSRLPAFADFRLRAASPARTGTPNLAYRGLFDLNGLPRPSTLASPEKGAYQHQADTAFPPLLTPAPGNFTAAQSVVLSSDTAGATIIYTTDGSAPAVNASGTPLNGSVYSAPLAVSSATTVRAVAWKSGLAASLVSGGNYTFQNLSAVPIPDLILSPAPGNFTATTPVAILCRTPGAFVRYTTDGSTPTPTSGTLAGSALVSVTNATTLKAIAYLPGRANSAVVTGAYKITGSLGSVSAGTTLESIGANRIRFAKFTSTSANTLANVYARVSGAGTYRVALYSDSSGQPSTRLATSNVVVNPAAGWVTFTFSTPVAVSASTSYWLAIWSDSATAQIYANTSGGTVREVASTLGGNGTWPNPVGTTAVSTNFGYTLSLYATPQNIAPAVTVPGATISVALTASASLSATVTDDGLPKLPGVTSVVWSKTGGPGTVTFANSAALATTAGFSTPGDYVLRVTATDGSLTSFAEVAVSVSAASGALEPTPPAGIVRARFTDGVGTTYPQQFAGVAGDGWTGPWIASASAGATVTNTTALQSGSGNYLALARTSGTTTSEGVYRQWSAATRPYNQFSRLTFDVRLDTDAALFTAYADQLNLTDRSGASVGTGGDSRFYIRVIGAATGFLQAREWGIYNGNGINTTFNDANFIPSGLICVPGVTYTFTIDVFAADAAGATGGKTHGTYDVTITDGTTTVTIPGSRFRSNTAFTSGGYLGFSSQQSADTDNLAFSVDNIEITGVAPTATALVSAANPADFGQGVTFTATVTGSAGTPAGSVVFRDGTTALGTASLNGSGVAVFTTNALAAGTRAITATYLGGPGYLSSTSTSLSQSVRADTVTILTSNFNPANLGAPVTFTATVTSETGTPAGTVSFISDSVVLGSPALDGAGNATLTTSALSVGLHSVTATYNGSAAFSAGTPGGLTQIIRRTDGTTRLVAINCAGPDVAGSGFEADYGVPGGSVISHTNPIDRSGATWPAPASVYQTERYGPTLAYTLANLPPSTAVLVRLHFSESWWGAVPARTPGTGKRFVNASINGVQRLAAFDVLAAAGAPFTAVIREYFAATDASGQLVVTLSGIPGSADVNAIINGLELYTVTPADAWRTAAFTPAELADPAVSALTADPDRDGLINLLEYALGSDPLSASITNYQLQITDSFLTLTFDRIADPLLTYEVQASPDLVTWNPVWTSTGSQNIAGPVTVSDTVPATPRRFLRLKVTLP